MNTARSTVLLLPRRPMPLARAAALLGAAVLAGTASAQRTADEVVAGARAALGWDRLAGTDAAIRVRGEARFLGTDAEQTVLFDGHGRFVQELAGPLSQANGTDGKTAWVRDWTGTARVLALGDLANADASTLLQTGGWTAAGDLLRFELAPADGEDGAGDDAIELAFEHADGVLVGTIRLDPETLRARTAVFGTDDTRVEWRFEDYRDHGGFVFPHLVELVSSGMTQSLAVASVERVPDVPPAAWAPRAEPPDDVRFDPDVPAALETKRAPTGHLLVHPTVNGEDLGWFIFDSGAGTNCISTAVVDALSEGPIGEIGARGIGGTVPSSFWRADELALGPVTVDDPIFLGLDLAFLEPHLGVPVGGILGYELLSRCAVELDMQGAAIAVFDPARYELPAGGRWEDVVLHSRHPCVRASFEGRDGVFKIDTGAAGDTVTFHYQVVHDLDLTAGRETTAGRAGGVGGFVGTRTGQLESFVLGGHEFRPLPASFALEDKGAFSDDYVWGNIGGKLLEPFRLLVFDYPQARIGFVPREAR